MSDNRCRREDVIEMLKKEGVERDNWTFGCDGCGAVKSCQFAYDPYNLDGDCLAEK